MLFVHPAILGAGRPLFDRLDAPLQLDLLETATYGDGVVLKRYAVRGASALSRLEFVRLVTALYR